MTDRLVRDHGAEFATSSAKSFRFLKWQMNELSPRTSWLVALVVALPVAWHFLQREGGPTNALFGAGVTLTLAAIVGLLFRRALFATVVVATVVAIVVVASTFKRLVMNMVVHAYDLFFYLSSWSTVSYLWSDHRPLPAGPHRRVLAIAGVAWVPRLSRSTARACRAAGPRLRHSLFASLGRRRRDAKGERRHMQFYYENLYVSSFYASWGETLETLWRGALMEAARTRPPGGPPFRLPHNLRDQGASRRTSS